MNIVNIHGPTVPTATNSVKPVLPFGGGPRTDPGLTW